MHKLDWQRQECVTIKKSNKKKIQINKCTCTSYIKNSFKMKKQTYSEHQKYWQALK